MVTGDSIESQVQGPRSHACRQGGPGSPAEHHCSPRVSAGVFAARTRILSLFPSLSISISISISYLSLFLSPLHSKPNLEPLHLHHGIPSLSLFALLSHPNSLVSISPSLVLLVSPQPGGSFAFQTQPGIPSSPSWHSFHRMYFLFPLPSSSHPSSITKFPCVICTNFISANSAAHLQHRS